MLEINKKSFCECTVKPAIQDTQKSEHLYKLDIRLWSQIHIHIWMTYWGNPGKSGHLFNQDTLLDPKVSAIYRYHWTITHFVCLWLGHLRSLPDTQRRHHRLAALSSEQHNSRTRERSREEHRLLQSTQTYTRPLSKCSWDWSCNTSGTKQTRSVTSEQHLVQIKKTRRKHAMKRYCFKTRGNWTQNTNKGHCILVWGQIMGGSKEYVSVLTFVM